jgi:ABC-type branched-subunit amino acid transport system ATPase component
MLKLQDIHAYYGQSHVLQGLSLDVNSGEVVGLLSRNGMGKTTTLKSVMGLVRVQSGSIELDTISLRKIAPHHLLRLGLGYIPQGQKIFPDFTVMENLRLGLPKGRMNETFLTEATQLFPTVRERLQQKAGTLSGGEQQMLAIARALLAHPKYLLMDEPTEGLMPSMVQTLEAQLKLLKNKKMGILLAEQNAEVALRVCDRLYILEKGRVRYEGRSTDISSEQLQKYLGVGI